MLLSVNSSVEKLKQPLISVNEKCICLDVCFILNGRDKSFVLVVRLEQVANLPVQRRNDHLVMALAFCAM